MAIYTVYEPVEAPDDITRADRTTFIREGFTLWGFVCGEFFLLWHRLWLAFVVWVVVIGALGWLFAVFHLPPATSVVLAALAHLFVGVEGSDLRRFSLERRGFRLRDVVSGPDRTTAELVFFSRRGTADADERTPAAWAAVQDPTPTVIGMFPDGSGA